MTVNAFFEAIVILTFCFNTVATVGLIIAVTNINRAKKVHWERIVELCKQAGVSYMGYWPGVRPKKGKARKSPSLAKRARRAQAA